MEREVTVDCPLDCEYLLASRKHEKMPSLEGMELPNRDIEVTEKLLRKNEACNVRAPKSRRDPIISVKAGSRRS